jgi:protein gp37
MNDTGIIWTEKTWNPLSGCQKISQGCKYCYAETLAEKYRGTPAFKNGFDLTLRPHKLREPFNYKEPCLIFTNSMSDLFWEQVPEDYRHKVLDVIEATPQHEYQVLTKRPEIMLEFSKKRPLPPNFWAGTTIEDQAAMYRLRIIKLITAEIRFISFEPLISPISFEIDDLNGIQWAITGGESGNHLYKPEIAEKRALVQYVNKRWEVRPDREAWVKDIRDHCQKTGTAFFHKQWGGNYPEAGGRLLEGKFYSEFPRLPGTKTQVDNNYLKLIESGKQYKNRRDDLLSKSIK